MCVGVGERLPTCVYADASQLRLDITCSFNQFLQRRSIGVVDQGLKQLVGQALL